MQNKEFSIATLIEAEAERLASSLRQKLIPHSGELGSAREQVVRDFIQQNLPRRLAVSTGFVFDVHGNVSEQMDVVIHEAEKCPIFQTPGGVKFFPCEGVVSVGQIKSNLTSCQELNQALKNLRSAKRLDRSGGEENVSEVSGQPMEPAQNHLHQMFTFVFIINRCMAAPSMVDAFYEHLCANPRHEWPNMIFAFDQFFLTHSCSAGICPNPMDSFAIGLVDESSTSELLLWFTRLLTQATTATHTAYFSYYRHLGGKRARPWSVFPYEEMSQSHPMPEHIRSVSYPNWSRYAHEDS